MHQPSAAGSIRCISTIKQSLYPLRLKVSHYVHITTRRHTDIIFVHMLVCRKGIMTNT